MLSGTGCFQVKPRLTVSPKTHSSLSQGQNDTRHRWWQRQSVNDSEKENIPRVGLKQERFRHLSFVALVEENVEEKSNPGKVTAVLEFFIQHP